ncbi:uncharacterized protein LOC128546565 [Mercenaria mercenaria]|uniref:uncharacterized protein LOC128546565 n=1 Tax=Mercenaria mercenaria TaxID=6596 RepID=UPI00234EE32F|nr:uncharacterized protein LOC128546565 [Mercenaria mercenaria]
MKMFPNALHVKLCCVFFVCYSSLQTKADSTDQEPQCTSKFDYDYKIIQELILLRQDLTAAKEEIRRQQVEIQALKEAEKSIGSTYIRWGRKVCPENGTNLIYSGFMGGSDKEQPGTGSNYLCLTAEPLWDHFKDTAESLGKITGVEYQFWNHRSNGAADFFGDNMFNHNAVCAVCQTKRSTSLMIPGRNRCYDGWTMEYSGYLVSGYYGDKSATEYVCLDRRPEKVVNGDADDEDNRLYLVEGICGKSLACPPYVGGREITCVVCTL